MEPDFEKIYTDLAKDFEVLQSNDHITGVIHKAYHDAVYDFYKSMFKHEFVGKFMETGECPESDHAQKYKQIMESSYNRISIKPPYALITINCLPETDLITIKSLMEKIIQRKIVKEYLYCFEIRTEDYHGLHVHFLLRYECRPYDLKVALKKHVKSVWHVDNQCILNIKYVTDENLMQKVNYVKGIKADKKMKSVDYSIAYRKSHNIEDFYESDPSLPCRVTNDALIEESGE